MLSTWHPYAKHFTRPILHSNAKDSVGMAYSYVVMRHYDELRFPRVLFYEVRDFLSVNLV